MSHCLFACLVSTNTFIHGEKYNKKSKTTLLYPNYFVDMLLLLGNPIEYVRNNLPLNTDNSLYDFVLQTSDRGTGPTGCPKKRNRGAV